MTNEEARNMLVAKMICLTRETSGTDTECNSHNCDNCGLNYEQGNIGEQKEALDLAIKALEQQPCEDVISRAEAEAIFRNARSKLNPSDYKTADEFSTRDLMLLNAEQFIHLLPSVTPQPKIGKWIDVDSLDGALWHECSECGETEFYATDYCPNCGCRMKGEDE